MQKLTPLAVMLAGGFVGCNGQEAKASVAIVQTARADEVRSVAQEPPTNESPVPATIQPAFEPSLPAPPFAPYHSTLQNGIDFRRDGLPDFLASVRGLDRGGRKDGMWFYTGAKYIIFEFKNELPKRFKLILNGTMNLKYKGFPLAINYGNDKALLLFKKLYDIKKNNMELEDVVVTLSSKTPEKVITIKPDSLFDEIEPGYMLLIFSIKILQ